MKFEGKGCHFTGFESSDTHHHKHSDFEDRPDHNSRVSRLCEMNVIEQMNHVCHTSIVQTAWQRGQSLQVQGWIYSINYGLFKDLNVTFDESEH